MREGATATLDESRGLQCYALITCQRNCQIKVLLVQLPVEPVYCQISLENWEKSRKFGPVRGSSPTFGANFLSSVTAPLSFKHKQALPKSSAGDQGHSGIRNAAFGCDGVKL